MATFGELGEKISKKLGQFETDLQSTEPDKRATAERMIPRLEAAMEKLIQGQEVLKAQRVQKDLAKLQGPYDQGLAQMEKKHGEGWQEYAYGGKPMSYQEGGDLPDYVTTLDYDKLDVFDKASNTYKGKSVKLPKQVAADRMYTSKRSKEIFDALAEMYPEANKIYSPQQLQESGYADEYYDLYDYTRRYEEAMDKYRGTAGIDEYGQGPTTPLREQQIGPRHHAFFDKRVGGSRQAAPEEADFIAQLKKEGKMKKGGRLPVYAHGGSHIAGLPELPVGQSYEDIIPEDSADAGIPEGGYTTIPEGTTLAGLKTARTNMPAFSEGFNTVNAMIDQMEKQGLTTVPSSMAMTGNIYEATPPEEKADLEEAAAIAYTNNKNKWIAPDPIKKKSDLEDFQRYVYSKDANILGATGVDSKFGKNTAAAYAKYGEEWKAEGKGAADKAEVIKTAEAVKNNPIVTEVAAASSQNPYTDEKGSVLTKRGGNKFFGPQTTKVEEFLINYLGFPRLEGEKYTQALARQDKRLNRKAEFKNPFENFLATVFNVDPQKYSSNERKDLENVFSLFKDRQYRDEYEDYSQRKLNRLLRKEDPGALDWLESITPPASEEIPDLATNPYIPMENIVTGDDRLPVEMYPYDSGDVFSYAQGGNLPVYARGGFWNRLGRGLKRGLERGRGRNDALSQAMATNVAPMDVRNQQNMGSIMPQATPMAQPIAAPMVPNFNIPQINPMGTPVQQPIQVNPYMPQQPMMNYGGSIPKFQTGFDWGGEEENEDLVADQPDDIVYMDPNQMSDPVTGTPSSKSKKFNLKGLENFASTLIPKVAGTAEELSALKYANPSYGPLEYAEGRLNPMAMAFMQRLRAAEDMQREAWAKAGERRDYKVSKEVADARRKSQAIKEQAQNYSGPMRGLMTAQAEANLKEDLGKIREKEQNIEAQWNDPARQASIYAQLAGQRAGIGSQYGRIGTETKQDLTAAETQKMMTDATYRGLLSADEINRMNFAYRNLSDAEKRKADQKMLETLAQRAGYSSTQEYIRSMA